MVSSDGTLGKPSEMISGEVFEVFGTKTSQTN